MYGGSELPVVVEPASSSAPLPLLQAVPAHVAIIMDGNGRWAQSRGLTRPEGHRAGAENLRAVIERFGEHGVPVLTLFAFSTENWGRPRSEVDAIMHLAGRAIDRDLGTLHDAGVQLRHLGDPDPLPKSLRRKVQAAVERTAHNDRMVVNLAFNYGGRADIVTAVRRLLASGATPEQVTEDAITAHLGTADLPDPDLLIRTGGERRLSNFLVWQAAYCEYHFTATAWPDFGTAEVDAALMEFSRRHRRFGLVADDGTGDPGPGA